MTSDSPTSEHGDTRFSTPVPELDDHRLQPISMPLADPSPVQSGRRLTGRSGDADPRAFLRVNQTLHETDIASREAEYAIVTDDERVLNQDTRSPGARKASKGHVATTPRRSANRSGHERRDRSPDSDTSSSSSSPPNSVEAFADPRRRKRANTQISRPASEIELTLERPRAISGVSQQRRPTITNQSLARPASTRKGIETPPEEDVCFPPPEETGKTYIIDYEELEEFVARCAQGEVESAIPDAVHEDFRKPGLVQPKSFPDLRSGVPKIITTGPDSEKTVAQVSTTVSDQTDHPPMTEKNLGLGRIATLPAQPDRFCLYTLPEPAVHYATHLGGLTARGCTFRDLFELPSPDTGLWWLDVVNPTEDELLAIGKAFRIHRLTVEDIQTQEAREKVELFHQYYFVVFRTFVMDKTSEHFLDPISMYIVVFQDGLLSFSYSEQPHSRRVRRRADKMSNYLSLGSSWVCYSLIDDIVDSFEPVIRHTEQVSEDIEDQVFIARDEDYAALLQQIGRSRKQVLNLMRLLGGKADVIKGFAKRCTEQFAAAPRADIGLYLGDIQDHVVTMMSNLGHVEKMLSRSHGNYLAQLNVSNLIRGNTTNDALSKITTIATIIVPLNLICGLFGMNVPVPGGKTKGLGMFFGVIGMIICFVFVGLALAKRMKFI